MDTASSALVRIRHVTLALYRWSMRSRRNKWIAALSLLFIIGGCASLFTQDEPEQVASEPNITTTSDAPEATITEPVAVQPDKATPSVDDVSCSADKKAEQIRVTGHNDTDGFVSYHPVVQLKSKFGNVKYEDRPTERFHEPPGESVTVAAEPVYDWAATITNPSCEVVDIDWQESDRDTYKANTTLTTPKPRATTTEEPTTTTTTEPVRVLPESVFIERYDVYRIHYFTPVDAQHDTEGNYIVLSNWFRASLGWACGVHPVADIEAAVRRSFREAGYPDSWFNVLNLVPGIVEDGCEDPKKFDEQWYWTPSERQSEPELSDEDVMTLAAWATINVCQVADFDSTDLAPFAAGAVMMAEFASRELGIDLRAIGIDFEAAQEILWEAWFNSEDC